MRACRRHTVTRLLIAFLLLAALPNLALAATSQIKGTLTDKETGEPVVGASVLIVGTTQGAMTDFDGKYIIRVVEVGTYTLRITHLEYNSVEVSDVKVQTDLSTEVSRILEKKETDIGITIKVVSKRDVIDKFEVSNQVIIGREEIEHRPVTTVDELLSQVAGVRTTSSGEVFVRGGRAGEVAYYMDGVPIGDPLGGLGQAGANLSLVSGSIQEFTIIKDGFDPEYGNALSGIVKITTRTGSKDNTSVNIQYMTDDFGNKTLNEFSRNYDYLRFSLSGPDPFLKNKVLPAIGLDFLSEKEFTYYFYAEVDKSNGVYQYDRYDSPLTRRTTGDFSLFGIDIPERRINKYFWMTNLQFRPKPNLKLILSYKDSQSRGTLFGRDEWELRYASSTAPIQYDDWRTLSLEISQTISRDMNYEAIFSYSVTATEQRPGDPNNPGKGLDPDQFFLDSDWESWEDAIYNGVYDPPEPIINLFPDTAIYGDGLTGPAYTSGEWTDLNDNGTFDFGEQLIDQNVQAGVSFISSFRFNENGVLDRLEGEPFIDLNGNGVWDAGEYLKDKNGNGVLDYDRLSNVGNNTPEPYVDGDSIVGEPFTDLNANGLYDRGIDVFIKSTGPDNMDLNHNGSHDGPDMDVFEWKPPIPYVDRNGNGIFDPPNNRYDIGEPYVDINGNARYDDDDFLSPGNYSNDAVWHNRETKTYRGEVKIFRQIGSHELKAGFALDRKDFVYQEIEKPYVFYTGRPDSVGSIPAPYPTRGSFRDMFKYNPLSGTGYFRDKLEYGSMIASLGIRWDFFLQDKYDLVEVARNDDLGSGVIKGDRQKFSPRIGFSYPISDKAKVHFNYGHFFQLPRLVRMYSRNTSAINEDGVLGNYNLDYQKTIQYSFGVKYAMSENYSIDFSGYFKDEFDKINSHQVRIGGLTRQQYQNSDYGRSRGIEITLDKLGGGYVGGSINYTYAFAFGKASQTNENYLSDFELSREPLSEAALGNDIRHSLKSNIQVFVPSTVKPRLFGIPIPNGWSMSFETIIESGAPFTPNRDFPNISSAAGEDIQRNSMRMPSTILFDVRFTKDFTMVGFDYKFIVWVENLFDSKNVDNVYSNTGRADSQQNISGVILGGTTFDLNPANWDYGRQIRVGLEMQM